MKRRSFTRLDVSVLIVCVVMFGCGPPKLPNAKIAGTVKIDGSPLSEGSIVFYPTDREGGAEGGEIKDGKYSAQVSLGPKQVQIRAPKNVTGKAERIEGMTEIPMQEETLPAKFNTESELKFNVEKDNQAVDFDLTTK